MNQRPNAESVPSPPGPDPLREFTPADLKMRSFYGVLVDQVGEDGDVLFVGQPDRRRLLAALHAWWRWYDGTHFKGADLEPYVFTEQQARFSNHSEGCEWINCSCSEQACPPCLAGNHDGCDKGDYCECSAGYDHEPPANWCSCDCYCDEYAWWVEQVSSGGHPVTWMRYQPIRTRDTAPVRGSDG